MRKEYDFSQARRGAVIASTGKTRITIMLDNDILEFFRNKAEAAGTGYQTMINQNLRAAIAKEGGQEELLTVAQLRKVLREELSALEAPAQMEPVSWPYPQALGEPGK